LEDREILEETDAEETNIEILGPKELTRIQHPGPHHPGRCLL